MKCSIVLSCLWLVLPAFVASSYNHSFCIDGTLTEDSDACLTPDSCCRSFSFLFRALNGTLPSSTEIRVISNVSLNETICFEHLENIGLVGYGTTVSCTNETMIGSGLVFINITELQIEGITFENCSSLQRRNYSTALKLYLDYRASLYILNSTNVHIFRLCVTHSIGTGLIILDTRGKVTVSDSTFAHNAIPPTNGLNSTYSGGGGVRIEFTYCASGLYQVCNDSMPRDSVVHSLYTFRGCVFFNNTASAVFPYIYSFVHGSGNSVQGVGDGGGLSISVKGRASNNTFIVDNCTFLNNSAVWGGGLFFLFQDSAQANSVCIQHSHFTENRAYMYGGGGTCTGFIVQQHSEKNTMKFFNCTFHKNDAVTSGGAVSFFSKFYSTAINSVLYEECTWTNNTAQFGSAIEIAPDVWDSLSIGHSLSCITFVDCLFQNNRVIPFIRPLDWNSSHAEYEQFGFGTMLISQARVQFQGTVKFIGNYGTAINAISGIIEFLGGTIASFSDNFGLSGGAISLVSYSGIVVNDNSTFDFVHNFAVYQGGAIHVHSIDVHKHTSARTCFIEYKGPAETRVEKRGIILNFVNNTTPSRDGDAIHASTFSPCKYKCLSKKQMPVVPPFLHCAVTVRGQVNAVSNKGNDVTSRASDFTLEKPFVLHNVVPGELLSINFTAVDELQNERSVRYQGFLLNPELTMELPNVTVDVVSDTELRLYGNTGASGTLLLANDENIVVVNFSLGACPPGYQLLLREHQLTCYCSIGDYFGLEKCNTAETRVYISHGYWMGFCNEGQDALCTGHCPEGYCMQRTPGTSLLPKNASDLDGYICDSHRTGVLCGSCKENYSAYYHSPSVRCGDETYCRWGWLFYVLSELVPVTILFLIVMLFSVSFTSGKATGFILFAQIIDSLSVSLAGSIEFPKSVTALLQVFKVVYSFFDMNFFAVEKLSFCLWKGASAMDVIAMKYLTVVYALTLVVISVFVMRSTRLVRCFSCLRVRTLKAAFIHGITAFLIMCYSQCAKASIEIFSVTDLHTIGPTFSKTVLVHSGDTLPFHSDHLIYAIPSLFFIGVIVTMLPLLLIVYPLVFKALSYCRLNETRLVSAVYRLIPIQILDSFQGCYKDDFRFFAGFYFLYRMLLLVFGAAISSVGTTICLMEVFFVLVLALHSVVQPYKKQLYNIIDSLIFANLVLINGITVFNYLIIVSQNEVLQVDRVVAVMSAFQVVLISLPLLILLLWAVRKLCKRPQVVMEVDADDESSLPLLREEDSSVQ